MISLSISLAIVTKKLLNVSVISLELGSDLFMRVCLETDNRSNPIPGCFRVVFVFFKIVLVVI